MNQININQSNGLKFEKRFLQELQSRFKTVKTSHSTKFMYICDIVHDDCLIELKSNRDAYGETTKQTFQKICRVGLKSFQATKIPKGLFFQTLELLKRERSMIIVGNYNIEPNKLYNLFIKNPDQAWSNYTEYKIHTHWECGSSYTRISAIEFWKLADKSISIGDLKVKVEEYALNHSGYPNDFDILNHYTGCEHDSAFNQLEVTKDFQDPFITKWLLKAQSEDWVPSSAEPSKIDISKLKFEIAKEEPKRADGYTYPIIDQGDMFSKQDILQPENLKKIEDGIKDQIELRHLSIDLGYSNVYLTGILTSKESYKSKNWITFKKWIYNLMEEVDYNHKPTQTIHSIEEAQKAVRRSRRKVQDYEKKLEKQIKKHKAAEETDKLTIAAQAEELKNKNKTVREMIERHTKQRNEINDLKTKLNNQERKQVDETTVLKLEAYQAEIEKLKNEQEESVTMQVVLTKHQRDWLRRQAFENDSKMSKILRSILDEAMKEALLKEKCNHAFDTIYRYERIIDMIMDK